MTFLHILRKMPVLKICKLCRYNLILDLFTTKLATINWYSKCFHPICGCYLLKNSKFVWTRYSIYLLLRVFRRPLLFLSFYDHSHVALFEFFMFPDFCILLSDIKIMQKFLFIRIQILRMQFFKHISEWNFVIQLISDWNLKRVPFALEFVRIDFIFYLKYLLCMIYIKSRNKKYIIWYPVPEAIFY